MMRFAKQIVVALLCIGALSAASAQPSTGPGPGPVPDPWINNGGTLYYDQGGITVPSTVTGGTKGVGTINARGLYVNGVPVFSNSGTVIFASRVDAVIGTDQNNWTPTGTGSFATSSAVFVDGGLGDFNITGLTGGVEGRFIWLSNSGATNNIVVKNQSSSSTSANRFLLPADITLTPNMGMSLRYDATAGRWRQAESATLYNVTGSTPPPNGFYLSSANTLGVSTNGTHRADFNSAGSLFWVGSADGPGIVNQSGAAGPVFVPDKAHLDTGVGGSGGGVVLSSNGIGVIVVDTALGGAVVATANFNSSNNLISTTAYADRAAKQVVVRKAGATPVTVTRADYFVCVNVGTASAVNLPASPATGDRYEVKDCSGNASTFNITVYPNSGTIDGASMHIINLNYGALTFTYNGTEWNVT